MMRVVAEVEGSVGMADRASWSVTSVVELTESEAEFHADEAASFAHGMSVSFQATLSAAAIRHAAEAVGLHYPSPLLRGRPGNRARQRGARTPRLPRGSAVQPSSGAASPSVC